MRPRNTCLQYWHTPAMQAFPHWGTSRPEHPSCGGKSGCSMATANQIGCIGPSFWHWWQIYQMERCSKPFSTSSSQSLFYLQAAESAFVTYCESMWGTKGSPCPFRIEMTGTGERRKKEDMMVASQAEDPKLYVAHSRSQQHRLKI